MRIGRRLLTKYVVLIAVAAVALLASGLRADDINPPHYRQHAGSTVMFWMQEVAGVPLQWAGWQTSPGAYPLSQHDGGNGPGNPHYEIEPEASGDIYHFFQPNFEDPFPWKLMRIQLTFGEVPGGVYGGEPSILGISAFHPAGTVFATSLNHVHDTPTTSWARDYYYEDWFLEPFNPWWEIVDVFVPTGTELNQVVIDTLSFVALPAIQWVIISDKDRVGHRRSRLRS